MRKQFVVVAAMVAFALFGALEVDAQTPVAAGIAPVASGQAAALPPAPARATMLRVCSTCHAPEIAAQQRLTPDGWKDLVNKMADQGAVASDPELSEITAYLSASFPAATAGGAAEQRR